MPKEVKTLNIDQIRKSNKLVKELEEQGFYVFYNFKNNRKEVAEHKEGLAIGYINKDLEVIKY